LICALSARYASRFEDLLLRSGDGTSEKVRSGRRLGFDLDFPSRFQTPALGLD
jgi:hypothetical protein